MAISRAARTSHAARRTSTSFWRLPAYHLCGRPGRGFLAAEPRYQRAKDGRRLGTQAAADRADHNYARGRLAPRTALFYGFESAARNDILLYALPGFHQHGPPISAYKFKPPREVSPLLFFFALLHTRHSSPLLFLSAKLERKRTGITPPFPPCLKSPPHGFPLAAALSLSLSAPAFRHSDKSENPRFVFFLFPHSKRVAAAFSLPRARCLPSSLCCLPRIRGHASAPLLFFLLSTRFATSLTFVFRSFSSASRIKREFSGPSRAFPQTPTHSPATSSPCSSTRAPSALGRKIFLRRRGFRQRFSSKHSTTARELRRGARGRCPRRGEEEALRHPTRTSSSLERRTLSERPPRKEDSSAKSPSSRPRRALFYGRPGRGFLAAEPRYQGARDGRRVGSQAAADRADHNYARGRLAPRTALFYGFESAARNDILLYALPGFHQHGPPDISLQI